MSYVSFIGRQILYHSHHLGILPYIIDLNVRLYFKNNGLEIKTMKRHKVSFSAPQRSPPEVTRLLFPLHPCYACNLLGSLNSVS